MKILLIGNPNVGKSVIFNRLTGAHVIASNYPGTTVEFTQGKMKYDHTTTTVIDVPGIYSLEPASTSDEIAVKMIEEHEDAVLVNVVEATNLERNLNLTLQLIQLNKPMILILNFWDETHHLGIDIDHKKLEEILGIPCIPTCAVTGEGIKTFVDMIPQARIPSLEFEDQHRWDLIGSIVKQTQNLQHRHHTILERIGDISVKPVTGIPLAVIVLLATFKIIQLVGEGLINYVMDPIFEMGWKPLMMRLSGIMGSQGIFHDLIIGRLVEGEIDFGQSFGVLTTGLYVPLAAVLPYIVAFYLVLSFLEDSGYLPRLAVMVDTILHRLGLHGLAIVPMLLGLGCNVPGALATRILESRRERFIAMTLMAIAVPCMALQAMIVGLVGEFGIKSLATVYGTLFLVWIVLGVILNRILKGESYEIFVEIPPYRIPYFQGLVKKIAIRITWFVKEAVPFVLLGVVIANLLYTFKIIEVMGNLAKPLITNVLGLPQQAIGALLMGFLRKDIAVGMLIPLGLTEKQLVVASLVLAMYFPCVATFSVLFKELGIKDLIKAAVIMIISSVSVGALVNYLYPW
ncbi:MAG: iron transporter FeoB [Desulfuromonas sp. SDB]|nr:MAG: iron transporter FeoB [Desulfuromonas sp. SDB]